MEKTRVIRELTCIVCPRGCPLKLEFDGEKVLWVEGNFCKRGVAYAENECLHPMRSVSSTVKTSDGGVVAVRTDADIPKDKMFECMKLINSITVELPVKVGDVVADNVFGSRIIITQNKK